MWAPQPSCTLLSSRQLTGGFPLNRCSAQPLLRSTVAPLNRCSAQPLLRSASLHRPGSVPLRYTTCPNTTGVLSPHCIVLCLPYLYCIHRTCLYCICTVSLLYFVVLCLYCILLYFYSITTVFVPYHYSIDPLIFRIGLYCTTNSLDPDGWGMAQLHY